MTLSPISRALPLFTLGLVTLVLAWLYHQALPGYWLFDDEPNLGGLGQVRDWRSALSFTLSGDAGPIGRPLSLATFALQAEAWPYEPGAFLKVNFMIHGLAVWAVAALALGLTRLRPISNGTPATAVWVAVAVASLWGLSPFLATTHLMIIQRMTSLSGLLAFIALAVFVWAHPLNDPSSLIYRRYLRLALAGVMTFLATLAKENGVLAPVLALMMVLLWMDKDQRPGENSLRWLYWTALLLPSFMLMAYLGQALIQNLEHGYAERYFSFAQRLLSQPTLLMVYMRQLMLPEAVWASPFMDQLAAPKGLLAPPTTLLAILAWPLMLASAAYFRARLPALIFGLSFFLAGHLLESTFIGLELFFAHRNYLPSFGLYFAVVYTAFQFAGARLRLASVALAIYMMLFATVLFQVTTNWNHILLRSQQWLELNPHSQRAVQVLVNQYVGMGDMQKVQELFDQATMRHPGSALLQIQRTQYCAGKESDYAALIDEVEHRLANAVYDKVAAGELFRLASLEKPTGGCIARNHEVLARLIGALFRNPLYERNPYAHAHLTAARGMVLLHHDQNLQGAISQLIQAFDIYPSRDFVFLAAKLLANSDQFDRANHLIDHAVDNSDRHSRLGRSLIHEYTQLKDTIDHAMKIKARLSEENNN